jgi:regulatory protein
MSAYTVALNWLARRELSASQVRLRLLDRDHTREEIDAALAKLLENGALDDRRVARAYARTALAIKGRGRLRVARELETMGIAREVAGEAIAEVFGEHDERALIDKAIRKKLRGRKLESVQERARLYRFLLRQGFPSAAISAALRKSAELDDTE